MYYPSIFNLIANQSQKQPDNIALIDIEGKTITYDSLLKQINKTASFLNRLGIGKNDPVALVLPNGPMMASAFLSVASCASSAPLNPSFTASEFEYYLRDLNAKAVLVQHNSNSPVIQVATELDIPVVFLTPDKDVAEGLFSCSCITHSNFTKKPDEIKMSDIALILHTSGTTSRPKMVPLTHKNLCTSAENIHNTLSLSAEDRCLNIMPLFHIHGLMAALLASIAAGASIVCTPGFYAPKFFGWLQQFRPTWYTAVPTMHQSILIRSKDYHEIIESLSLRLIRSSSASLPPEILTTLEKTFGIPLIEAYGMTEASHQISSNPLPPGIRKAGSVGRSAGPEIAIMAEQEPEILSPNVLGEIVIRGDNVTLGYLNNPDANLNSFSKGWFRTGDQGYLDQDGYLFITGRLKEIINRGGEKISPKEVDEVLLKHPDVSQALTFSIPDETLGENVAAAVILEKRSVSELELMQFSAKYLAPHKVPSKIVILDKIPKGPTGKLQRIGLAQKLGLANNKQESRKATASFISPQTTTEKTISQIWEEILDVQKIGIHTEFRTLGGDSMLATLIHSELEKLFNIAIPLVDLYQASTIDQQARLVERILSENTD